MFGLDLGAVVFSRGFRTVRAPFAVCVVTTVLALFPLIHIQTFYFWDDSAAVFVPGWYHIGTELLAGRFPALSPDMWPGGNIAAEAQLSLWNPIMLANHVLVALMPDVAVAATVVKIEFMVLMALGVYLLCREYGARQWPSATVAVLLPFAGFTLYFDASAWAISMISFAWIPHLWWAARKCADGRLNPVVPVFFGIMAMTCGSPYGALGAAAVVASVLFERAVQRSWSSCVRLLLIGVAIAMSAVVVYVPLVLAGEVSFRGDRSITNTGFMVAALGDLLNLSSPTYTPNEASINGLRLMVPYAFLGWFVLPLLPWLRWSAVRANLRARSALFAFCVGYALFATGPGQVWLFRWPMRVVDYVYLPVCVFVALALSAGLRADRVRRRAFGTAVLIGIQAALAFSATPEQAGRHAAAAVILAGLSAAAVFVALHRERLLPVVLTLGTAVVLFAQLTWYPINASFTAYRLPHNVQQLRDRFAGYEGNTFTVSHVSPGDPHTHPDGLWRDMLAGSMYEVAGVTSLNSYTGMGYAPLNNGLCMHPSGATCPEAFHRLFAVDPETGVPVADLLRVQNVVVRNGFVPNGEADEPPAGWQVLSHDEHATVFRRAAPLPWPQGRVSWTSPGLEVLDDRRQPRRPDEEIRYRGEGTVTLAALAWPGVTASVDGKDVPVRRGPMGIITVDLPKSSDGATLRLGFSPPGFSYGIPLLAGAVLLGLLHGLAYRMKRRRRPDEPASTTRPSPAPRDLVTTR
ncbi:hypothetical protein C8D88_109355 [Lentzea atacamensis]|uniref:Membrane protein YfhO n=1 Tax=Lentzea atacamensis TaxID=531938 RepID=A0A316HUC2_9PSEU|nr:hypothetical protein C8D88_109355 [Lentzea atacamensis]